jgi:hypothetical protein
LKWRSKRGIEKAILVYNDLDLAGFQIRVGHPLWSQPYLTADGNDVLRPKSVSTLVRFSVALGIEHHLRDAGPVAKIDEDEPAMIPSPLNPPHEDNMITTVLRTKGAAIMSTLPVT